MPRTIISNVAFLSSIDLIPMALQLYEYYASSFNAQLQHVGVYVTILSHIQLNIIMHALRINTSTILNQIYKQMQGVSEV